MSERDPHAEAIAAAEKAPKRKRGRPKKTDLVQDSPGRDLIPGRPKGKKYASLAEVLEAVGITALDGKGVIDALIENAKQGDKKSLDMLWDLEARASARGMDTDSTPESVKRAEEALIALARKLDKMRIAALEAETGAE